MPASFDCFTCGDSFVVMLPRGVRRFRYRGVGFAIGAEAAVEFDLRLKGFVCFAEVMPAGGHGQGGAVYPGFLQDGVQLPAHIVGVLGDGLPVAAGYRVLLIAIVAA